MSDQTVYDLFSVEGKKALVTGGSVGLGRAMAEALVEGGARVAIVGWSERVLDAAQEMGAIPLQADLADRAQTLALVDRAAEALGGLDILVNNASVSRPKQLVPLGDLKFPGWQRVSDLSTPLTEEEWQLTLDSNLTSIFLCTRAVGLYMVKQRKGKIINISSNSAELGVTYFVPYNTSKAAASMFTRCLAVEWAPFNINVNAIGPGDFHTRLSSKKHETPEMREHMLSGIPLGRVGELRELGLLAVYLASDASNYMTGQTLYLDGGRLAL
ncbi:MAG: SDR family oxidoreductase [Dehalococcoidia bacterium]|nr:SDR family oxidoreductase [Dehalococcoidia bacterium]